MDTGRDMSDLNTDSGVFEEFLRNTGYTAAGWTGADSRPGRIVMSEDYAAESGGILKAVSRRAAGVIRQDLKGLEIRDTAAEYGDRWKYILTHSHPHLDEYLASLLLRSSLPDEMYRLTQDETALYSADDDASAKAVWPSAALLGVGNTVNGGAEAMLIFDEHETPGGEKKNSSLVMLMKRYLIGSQQPPKALYQMLRETNYIDQYGEVHPKDISAYAKHLQSVPLPSAGGELMTPEWKFAVMDFCLAAFYLGLRTQDQSFRLRREWEPALRSSLDDFAVRTPLRGQRGFDRALEKIRGYLTDQFAWGAAHGKLKYAIPSPSDPSKKSEAELNMLVPYLPALCSVYWGEKLSRMMLYPLWECRVNREMLTESGYQDLCRDIPRGDEEAFGLKTGCGTLNVACCKRKTPDGQTVKIIDLAPSGGLESPAPLNQYIKNKAGGMGIAIYRGIRSGTTMLCKGAGIDQELWRRICEKLVEEEGASDDPVRRGSWHVTRNPMGIAPFLLNGNATHRYVPKSAVTAVSLAGIVDSFLEQG